MIEALNVTVEQTNLANYTDGPVTEVNTAPEVVSGTRFFDGPCSVKCNETNIHPSCRTDDEEIIKGTILIPCRTATRGKFPVNGAFFQINEVFADHESSELPVDVPKAWVCNLPKRSLHCAMTATTIFRDATSEEIQYCLSRDM
ncbi:putative demeter, domain-containing protein [Heracleum sosnowskyi]|uniref:Demeter, domain-containing protein n=1 Tax=Heracleum sosnowskyi TaxID=360622 RepID=A0AAD8I3G8_9APIA|nr:putative demeter, domain-containing protein [Heracleum sosnowskyi]